MKSIVAAYHNMGCAGMEALLRNGFEIQAVFTYQDNPDEASWFNSVAELASHHHIPVWVPDNINHPLWVDKIRALQPDILFSFYYRDLIGKAILDIPQAGCLNLHGSLLPKYRGRAPINWAIINGETATGVSMHYMTERADDGDIINQRTVAIEEQDTAALLNSKMVEAAAQLLEATLPLIKSGTALREPQNHRLATYFGRRTPADGAINWELSSQSINNLVRAVTRPYPGAFTYRQAQKIFIWKTTPSFTHKTEKLPGTILSVKPLTVACSEGVLQINFGQYDGGIYMSGEQLAEELDLVPGIRFNTEPKHKPINNKKVRVLILGVNGFIGNALTRRLLNDGTYEVHGMDLNNEAIQHLDNEPDFYFHEGDIAIHREWIEYHIKKCDVIIPLVAIATPIEYTRNPLRVFELDFEENLRIVRYCVKYNKRIIFPSTSEVYGMCDDNYFDENTSNLVVGPINKQRWIYSISKQLLDRVIWAYGKSEGLNFTLFRPFNWIGPRLDTLESARIGSSRAITQLILNLVEGTPIQLIDGGAQKRCFTDVTEGIECLFRIIENRNGVCDGKIFNIGNPDNEVSIQELAEILLEQFETHRLRSYFPPFSGMQATESHAYYGDGYQDVQHRRPRIDNAKRLLNWESKIPLSESVASTLDFFLLEYVKSQGLTNSIDANDEQLIVLHGT